MPSVRALAGELGVDLTGIRGTGPGGRILKQDVEDVAEACGLRRLAPVAGRRRVCARARRSGRAGAGCPPRHPRRRRPPAGRRRGASHRPVWAACSKRTPSVRSSGSPSGASGAPWPGAWRESVAKQAQVTTMDEADVTIIKRIREKERTVAAERGVRLTYLAFVIKACTASLKRFPRLNAVLEESGDEFVLKRYYNIGIAIDTKSGLVVPEHQGRRPKSIFEIAEEIVDLVDRAEQRTLDLQRAPRRHVHHHQLRRHRRPVRHAGDQLSGGGHPGDGTGARDAGGPRGQGGDSPDAPAGR